MTTNRGPQTTLDFWGLETGATALYFPIAVIGEKNAQNGYLQAIRGT